MQADINTLTSTRVPRGLTELITLGRTLKRRAGDILAYFDHPHTSNGPTEAINAPPRTPTRNRPRACETSPTTSPEHSSKPEDSNPNYTSNCEELCSRASRTRGAAQIAEMAAVHGFCCPSIALISGTVRTALEFC